MTSTKQSVPSKSKSTGALKMILLGPMGCGKTTELLIQLNKRATLGRKVIYINFKGDDRKLDHIDDGQHFTSHNSLLIKLPESIKQVKVETLAEVDVSAYSHIGVDEFQFYQDSNPVEVIRKWVLKQGKKVYVAGLDGDFRIHPFGSILKLIPLCESEGLIKLASVCVDCYKRGKDVKASFTRKLNKSNKQIEVGDLQMYHPVCLDCYYN